MIRRICLVALAICLSTPSLSRAQSQWECAIWLCLPVGFSIPECKIVKNAMFKRMLEFKSPVPKWSSCSVGGPEDANMDIKFQKFAIVDDPYLGTVSVEGATCTESWEGKEDHTLPVSPWCRDTVKSVQITQDGVPTGDTYYMDEDYNQLEYDVNEIPPPNGPLTKPQDPRFCDVAVPPDWCRGGPNK